MSDLRAENYTLKVVDCVKGLRSLTDESVDVVVTSPPYNLGIKYENYRDNRTRDQYLKWSCRWAKEVMRVLRDRGSFFLNLGSCPSNPLIPHELVVALKGNDVGFVLQNTFHWIKSITIEKDGEEISPGHFKPINSYRYVNDCHEYVFHLTKHGNTPLDRLSIGVSYADKSNIRRWAHTKGHDVRCRGNNWFIPYKTIVNTQRERPHPATFPVELAENCIRIHGNLPGLVVMDQFVGIGHSALAAKRCGVPRFIGFDISREYIAVARKALIRGVTEPTPKQLCRASERQKKSGQKEALLFDLPEGA